MKQEKAGIRPVDDGHAQRRKAFPCGRKQMAEKKRSQGRGIWQSWPDLFFL